MRRASTVRLLLLALIWGSGFFFIAIALRGFPPVLLTFARLALGAGALVPFVLAREGGLPRGWRLWSHLTVAALLSNAIPYTLSSPWPKPTCLPASLGSSTRQPRCGCSCSIWQREPAGHASPGLRG